MLPGLTQAEAQDLILSVGTFHGKRRLSPVEVAVSLNKAIGAGASPEMCASFAGFKGPSMVQHFLRLLRLDTSVHHLVGWKQSESLVPFIVAAEIARLNDDESADAFTLALSHQMTRLEVRQMIQLRRRKRCSVKQCADEVVRTRKSVVRKHVFLGAVTGHDVLQFLGARHQAERDALLAGVLEKTYGELPGTSGRLGVKQFTIVTDEDGAKRLKSGNFEHTINEGLTSMVVKA